VFGLLGAGATELIARITSDAPCLRDRWSSQFIEHWGEQFGGDDCIADVEATALLGRAETVQIETRHATLRRVLVARSVQSKMLDMDGLNCSKVARSSL
jgi:hypothetical protein